MSDPVTAGNRALASQDVCKGRACSAKNGIGHSKECMFDHFLAYTGYASQPESVREMLERAYFDGMDAAK